MSNDLPTRVAFVICSAKSPKSSSETKSQVGLKTIWLCVGRDLFSSLRRSFESATRKTDQKQKFPRILPDSLTVGFQVPELCGL